jgi:hypothetical protein
MRTATVARFERFRTEVTAAGIPLRREPFKPSVNGVERPCVYCPRHAHVVAVIRATTGGVQWVPLANGHVVYPL